MAENPQNIIRSWNVQTNFAGGPVTYNKLVPPPMGGSCGIIGERTGRFGLGRQVFFILPAEGGSYSWGDVSSYTAPRPTKLHVQEVSGAVRH